MDNIFDIVISCKQKNLMTANRGPCPKVVHHRSSFDVPLILLRLSYEPLKWIRCAFDEDSSIMRRYRLLTNLSGTNESRNISCSNLTTYVRF